jgi:hypothetical protein
LGAGERRRATLEINDKDDLKSVKDAYMSAKRSEKAIRTATEQIRDRVWYDRSLMGPDPTDPDILEGRNKNRRRVEMEHEGNLGPYTDFEWGMLNGKLSALRWVLGERWDDLGT